MFANSHCALIVVRTHGILVSREGLPVLLVSFVERPEGGFPRASEASGSASIQALLMAEADSLRSTTIQLAVGTEGMRALRHALLPPDRLPIGELFDSMSK